MLKSTLYPNRELCEPLERNNDNKKIFHKKEEKDRKPQKLTHFSFYVINFSGNRSAVRLMVVVAWLLVVE